MFSVGDQSKCHNYTIIDDVTCELGEMETIFKLSLTLVATDSGTELNTSRAVTTVVIDDSDEPECCKSVVIIIMKI